MKLKQVIEGRFLIVAFFVLLFLLVSCASPQEGVEEGVLPEEGEEADGEVGNEESTDIGADIDINLDALSAEEQVAILVDNGSSLTDEEKAAILEKADPSFASEGEDGKAVAGQAIAGRLNIRSDAAAARSRWSEFMSNLCMEDFRRTDQLYTTIVQEYGDVAGPRKMKIYRTPASIREAYPHANRFLKIVNDLEGTTTGFYTYWNTVGGVYLGSDVNGDGILQASENILMDWPAVPTNPFCIATIGATIDPNGASRVFPVTNYRGAGNYTFGVNIATFMPNLFELLGLSCTTNVGTVLENEVATDSWGNEIYNVEGLTLNCGSLTSSCTYWMLQQGVQDCDGITTGKGFTLPITNQCPGTTVEIKLSSLLPDGYYFSAEDPLCDVW